MDNLVRTLKALTEPADMITPWGITNKGAVTSVHGISAVAFLSPVEAFVEAQRMVEELLADGRHCLVNRAELSATSEPIGDDQPSWRGRVDVVVWEADDLQGHHIKIPI